MQQKILIAIFATLILVLMAIFFIIFNTNEHFYEYIKPKKTPTETIKEEKKDQNWVDKLALVDKTDHSFAVNDLFIKIDLKIEKKKITTYESIFNIAIDNHDRYSLFCIKQTLDQFLLPYTITKLKNQNSIITIQSKDASSLEPIIQELKKYNINAYIKEMVREKSEL